MPPLYVDNFVLVRGLVPGGMRTFRTEHRTY